MRLFHMNWLRRITAFLTFQIVCSLFFFFLRYFGHQSSLYYYYYYYYYFSRFWPLGFTCFRPLGDFVRISRVYIFIPYFLNYLKKYGGTPYNSVYIFSKIPSLHISNKKMIKTIEPPKKSCSSTKPKTVPPPAFDIPHWSVIKYCLCDPFYWLV